MDLQTKSSNNTWITLIGFIFIIIPLALAIFNITGSAIIFKIYATGILVGAVVLSVFTDILKDVYHEEIDPENQSKTVNDTKTYSFSKVQGMWWTVIIGFCYVWAYSEKGVSEIIKLNGSCLTLLGIGIGTTVIGSVIDNTDKAKDKKRYQDFVKSQGFFWDILCDGKTITVHRFQSLIFNVVFGLVFIIYFFSEGFKFKDFDTITLGLLGISSSAYLTMKAVSENNEDKSDAKAVGVNNVQNQKVASEAVEKAKTNLLERIKAKQNQS